MLKRFTGIIFSRLSRNIVFWLVVGCIRVSGYEVPYTAGEAVYCLCFFVFLAAALYLNNLVLIPRLLAKKKYILYPISVMLLTLLASFLSVALLEFQRAHHPGISPFKSVWIPFAHEALAEHDTLVAIHVFMFLVYILIFTLCWYANDYSRKQKEVQRVKQQQTETELRFLKDQLNPHFLFNTLNNLYGLSLQGGNTVSQPILQLSAILRYLLYESNTERVSFSREKQVMQAYIELELLRLSDLDNVMFTINADKEYSVPPLLWLPVLENVFKHSRHSAGESDIEFKCYILNNTLHIFSCNSHDVVAAASAKAGGIGMENLKKRLQLLYPGKHTIVTQDSEGQYVVDIKVELT